jgi:hypothetical protein
MPLTKRLIARYLLPLHPLIQEQQERPADP